MPNQYYFLAHSQLDGLLADLRQRGYRCKGPRVIEQAIVYDDLESAAELPWGYVDEQAPSHYQITKTDRQEAFAWTVPAQSVKTDLFKSKEVLWRVTRDKEGKLCFESQQDQSKYAIIGVRPCDLRAIEIQDRVFIDNSYQDVRYKARREQLFIIAANCTSCHSNCFCVSLGDTPRAESGFDLAMTEIEGGFVLEIGSDIGRQVLSSLALTNATDQQWQQAQSNMETAISMQSKRIPDLEVVEKTLSAEVDHPRWDDVAKRCLSCGSCTQVCPTCFCHTEKEQPALDGQSSEHIREWDSCFGLDHSYTHGQLYREQPKHRYRQWLVHKFSTWREQFKTKGCVGCGRCISWCPVKIDVTEEINAICEGKK